MIAIWHCPSMRTPAQQVGDAAEALVAQALAAAGWSVLGMHVRVSRAEIDLVAIDHGPPAELVIVEVRWRGRRDFGLPEESVDGRKRARLHRAGFALRAAGALADGTSVPQLPLRFDLVVVEPNRHIRHHRNGL